ncbi:uncharacterized protein LOC131802012 [Musca domestica]|uniref:Uncharacterized protein LOC131802012 n=1 Tax=Musca domestica TaxID=7370 RepID=A0ABM3UUW4_MUSDO|nr:uncharacterized protein LOC131802012 [Musca domestica]
MISNLESYCEKWNLKVNMSKSEILIFRKGGRLGRNEKWKFNGNEIKNVNEYKYLGVTFTPKLSFSKHIEKRTSQSKMAINSTWIDFLGKKDVNMKMKWKVYEAVCRSVQTYAAQVWGYSYFDEVDKLQRYFLKKILKVPSFTPNYALMLETNVENCHLYTLKLNLKYIHQVLYRYQEHRLPTILTNILLEKEGFWVANIKSMAHRLNVQWPNTANEDEWTLFSKCIIGKEKTYLLQENLRLKQQSQDRIYKHLDYRMGEMYFTDSFTSDQISWIFKARCGLINLNATRFNTENAERKCTLCNLIRDETLQHFIGECPILAEFRTSFFQSAILSEEDVINILDGREAHYWRQLVIYLKICLNYREFLIFEYNSV